MSEEILHSEYLYRGRIIKLRLDQVRLANRAVVAREIVEHRGAVVIIAIDERKRVLMVRQFRSGVGRELLELPAGTLEDGEDPALCATRELKEETGYSAIEWRELGYFYSSPGFCTEKMFLYLARKLTPGIAAPEEDELIHVESMPLTDLLAMVDRGEIIDSKSIIGLLRVKSLLGV
jgi:ADP-ribose pyrophosphatase